MLGDPTDISYRFINAPNPLRSKKTNEAKKQAAL